VVMEHAFRGVQHVLFRDAKSFQLGEHIVEVTIRRLVETDILSRINRVEFETQLLIGGSEISLSTLDRMMSL
jgi:hypothetical protein